MTDFRNGTARNATPVRSAPTGRAGSANSIPFAPSPRLAAASRASSARRDDRFWDDLRTIAAEAEGFAQGYRQGLAEALEAASTAPVPSHADLVSMLPLLRGAGWAAAVQASVKGTRAAVMARIKTLMEHADG